MTITEPMTMLTDYLLAILSLYFAISLYRECQRRDQRSVWLWATGFLLSSVAALIGGTYHGFATYLTPGVLSGMWNLTIFLIGMSGGFMISGGFIGFLREAHLSRNYVIAGIGVSFIAFLIQQSSLDIHRHFNHDDLFHCVQMIALYLFYRGAKVLFDKDLVPNPVEDNLVERS
jgi:hypothetical protein